MEPLDGSIAVALEALRGAVNTGFAQVNGRLDTNLERLSQAEREIESLKKRLAAAESKMWKLSMAAAVIGSGGGAGVLQLVGGG